MDWSLQQFSHLSQIGLVAIALIAAIAAFSHLRTFKLFELLKFIEAADIREARRVVTSEIAKLEGKWWHTHEDADRLEMAASRVCAAFDMLGRMIAFDTRWWWPWSGYETFFSRYPIAIVRSHHILRKYLHYRRKSDPTAYKGFTDLARRWKSVSLSG